MGQITVADAITQITPALKTEYFKQYKGVPTNYDLITQVIPSDNLSETYGWLGQLPALREFGAERIPKGLSEYKFTITNKKWEASVRVDNDLLRFEKYGQVKSLVGGIGATIPRGKNKTVWDLFAAAATTTCYDGQYFIDTDHQEGNSGVQSNKLTVALTPDNYAAARVLGRGFKDDQGNLVGNFYGRMLLVVGPTLEATARKITDSSLINDGGIAVDNPWKGTATTVVNPYLADTNDWYLVDVDSYLKPIILQEVGNSGEFGVVTDTRGGETDFMRDFTCFGTPITYFNAGLGDWRTVVGSIVP